MALTPEILIPRLGDLLVEQGLLTQAQLIDALDNQKQLRLQGTTTLLGQVIVQMGLIDQHTLDQAITRQILILQNNLIQANETLEQRVKERTAELEIAYKKLSELSLLKANFISNISHELRTPLTHMNGYTELLYTKVLGELNPDQTDALRVLKKASERLERLIEDLILFTTSESNKLVLDKTSFVLTPMLHDLDEQYSEIAQNKGVRLSTEKPAQEVTLFADRNKIFWVIHHLLDNALKFTPSGGNVLLKIEPVDKGTKISVIDDGIGIPKDKVTEIFDAFHQLDGSSTRQQGGTGLGLSLVKKIIEAHGSSVQVETTLGKGSTFSFCLFENS